MIRLLIDINPEPWTSPSLGIKKIGRRAVPISFKNENQRAYQEAVHELVEEALAEQGIEIPVFSPGTQLRAQYGFWRQLDRFSVGDAGRTRVRQQPDLTNLVKATEDALQGLIYKNDRAIRYSEASLVDVGPDVEPAVMVLVEALTGGPFFDWTSTRQASVNGNGVRAKSQSVWIEDGRCRTLSERNGPLPSWEKSVGNALQ